MKNLPTLFIFATFYLLLSTQVFAQTITITSTITADTVGVPQEMHASMDHRIDISASSAVTTSHFRVGIGMEQGDETMLSREFSTAETGTFDDGCSLVNASGNWNICLGTFSGLEDFTVTITPILGDGSDGTQAFGNLP